MPKIKITEKDNTGLFEYDGLSNTVYIPGLTTKTAQEETYVVLTEKPTDWYDSNTPGTFYKQIGEDSYSEVVPATEFVPVFEANSFYKYDSGDYVLLEDEPADWNSAYFNYYVENADLGIKKIEKYPFTPNTYYRKAPAEVFKHQAPVLFTTASELDEASEIKNGSTTTYVYDKDILSYKVAHRLLRLGLQVVYEQITTVEEISWDAIEDKNQFNIRFISGGCELITATYTPTGVITAKPIAEKFIECASKRGDCVALVDHPSDLSSYSGDTYALKVRDFFSFMDNADDAESTFAGGFSPWFTLSATLSNKENITEYIPASFGYLFAYAKAIQTNPEWYAAAGSFRGIIDGIDKLQVSYSMSDVEVLQGRSASGEVDLDGNNDNVGFAINTITNVTPFGKIVWGNRTLRDNKADGNVGALKATSFLNVRNLVSAIKKQLYFAAKKYTFEQNSDVLWVNFKSQITPLLDQMQSGDGIAGYKIEKLPTTKKARLKAKITIIPIEAVEDFELEVELADSLEVVE